MTVALLGIGVSRGTAIGRARIIQHGQVEVPEYALPTRLIDEEVERFFAALEAAKAQLRAIRERIPHGTPQDIAAFIDTHLLMLEDHTLRQGTEEIIRSRQCNAEWALKLQKDAVVRVFESMDDPYLRTRRDDIEHVVRRVQHILLDQDRHERVAASGEDGRIILADELSPAELVLLHHQNIAGIATERGGPVSHTAILARSLSIPAVVGVPHPDQAVRDDELVVLDGAQGVLLAGVDEADLAYYRRRQQAERRHRNELRKLRDVPAVTADGIPIELQANVELPEDVAAMRRAGATGVGLFRTEFLFMNRDTPPDEAEQFEAYRQMLRRLRGGLLTIRTLDLGADKPVGAFAEFAGPNPALGLRGVRLCLKEADLFVPQVRAILRASAFGPVRMLVPMLTNLHELQQVIRLVEGVKRDLTRDGLRFNAATPLGAMIEVPAAALCADSFAARLDFLSIGTNDLIQYTLATDRMDEEVNHLYDPVHPAVLRLIQQTLRSGTDAGIPVGMCGEMAGDPRYTRLLLGLGLREFSMPPSAMLEVKRVITQSNTGELRRRVARLLRCTDPEQLTHHLAQLNA
ncbi:MAG: phosphoenolpyruvate--protein phosphotransferase [Thiohalomonadaceae bacterium]